MLHLIYITGLGDSKIKGQVKAVKTWRLWRVESEVFQVNWADKEPWERKFERLLKRIDDLSLDNKQVGLVGVSAGATAAINAYAARRDKIIGCVLIAGKVNRPNHIDKRYRDKNPAFVTSAADCEKALRSLDKTYRKRILSRYGLADEKVFRSDSYIAGAKNQIVPSIGHYFTIGTQITFGAPSFIRFLRQEIR